MSRCPCSRWPSWRRCGGWPTGRRKKVDRRPGADRADGPGGPSAAGAVVVGSAAGGRRRPGLVGVAAGPPGAGAAVSLQEEGSRTSGLVTTVVLREIRATFPPDFSLRENAKIIGESAFGLDNDTNHLLIMMSIRRQSLTESNCLHFGTSVLDGWTFRWPRREAGVPTDHKCWSSKFRLTRTGTFRTSRRDGRCRSVAC